MNPWSTERKIIYLSIVLAVFFLILVIPLFYFFHQEPTCFDKKQNGDEAGTDCGGSCQLLCSSDRLDPIVLWSRSFLVTNGVYSAAAYVQNPNISTEALAAYTFKFYDSENVLIATRSNRTIVPKNTTFAVFEPNIDTGGKQVVRATFEVDQVLQWRKNTALVPPISVTQKTFFGNPSARVVAVVENGLTEDVERIEVVAILYNNVGNAIGASRTFIDRISANQSAQVTFTWPTPFTETPSVIEVIPRIMPERW